MTYPRAHLISPDYPGFYHLTNRCVRRAWLCGFDKATGTSYEHRRQWVETRILFLSRIFAVELYGYAIMSNHYHIVLFSDPCGSATWSAQDVAERWVSLCEHRVDNSGDEDTKRAARIKAILESPEQIACYRARLASVSWYMRFLNEWVARKANAEDDCTGRFWEGRFGSQALLDESAVYAGLAYVDLNPVRAGEATSPETAKHTSLALRVGPRADAAISPLATGMTRTPLRLQMDLSDYLELLGWTWNRAKVPEPSSKKLLPHAFGRLIPTPHLWESDMAAIGAKHRRACGSAASLRALAVKTGQRWLKGVRSASPLPLDIQAFRADGPR